MDKLINKIKPFTFHIIIGTVGAILGGLTAILIGNVLHEITHAPIFSLLFGVLFEILALIIIWRVYATSNEDAPLPAKIVVFGFCAFVMFSGLFCIMYDVTKLSMLFKILMYTLLGISLTFSITYSALELTSVGLFSCKCWKRSFKPLVSTPVQVYIIAACAVILGMVFGFTFAVLNIEDSAALDWKFIQQQIICIPVAAFLGAVVALVNYTISTAKKRETEFDSLENRADGI